MELVWATSASRLFQVLTADGKKENLCGWHEIVGCWDCNQTVDNSVHHDRLRLSNEGQPRLRSMDVTLLWRLKS